MQANAKATKVTIRDGYVFADTTDGRTWVEAGTDRTFGIRDPQGARYSCNCGAHYNLPRDIASHLETGACAAL